MKVLLLHKKFQGTYIHLSVRIMLQRPDRTVKVLNSSQSSLENKKKKAYYLSKFSLIFLIYFMSTSLVTCI